MINPHWTLSPTKFANWSAKWKWSDHRWSKRHPFYIFAALWIQESQKMPSAPWRLHYAPLKCKTCHSLSTTDVDSRIWHCFTKDFALSLCFDRCETKGANQLFSDPAWRTEQDSPDWGGGKGEILPVLGTSTGSKIVLDLNYCRVLGPWNGQYGDYSQYWESQQVQRVMTSMWGM